MVLEKVRGFLKLKKEHQQLFIRVHAEHQKVIEDKERWQAVSVKWQQGCLKVTFNNGEWLHYTPSGTWY